MGAQYQLPGNPKSPDGAFNKWGAAVNRALAALRHSVDPPRARAAVVIYGHPFKISVDASFDASVSAGSLYAPRFQDLTSPARSLLYYEHMGTSTDPGQAIADATTYGVFLRYAEGYGAEQVGSPTYGDYTSTYLREGGGSPSIVYIAATVGGFVDTSDRSHLLIGTIARSGTAITIVQNLRSDVFLPALTYPVDHTIVVEDDGDGDITVSRSIGGNTFTVGLP